MYVACIYTVNKDTHVSVYTYAVRCLSALFCNCSRYEGGEENGAMGETERGGEAGGGQSSSFFKCICFTFNLWKCMELMKYNCMVDFDHYHRLSSARCKGGAQ